MVVLPGSSGCCCCSRWWSALSPGPGVKHERRWRCCYNAMVAVVDSAAVWRCIWWRVSSMPGGRAMVSSSKLAFRPFVPRSVKMVVEKRESQTSVWWQCW